MIGGAAFDAVNNTRSRKKKKNTHLHRRSPGKKGKKQPREALAHLQELIRQRFNEEIRLAELQKDINEMRAVRRKRARANQRIKVLRAEEMRRLEALETLKGQITSLEDEILLAILI